MLDRVRRFNVRDPGQEWDERGPDLLRTDESALAATLRLAPWLGPYQVRKMGAEGNFADWRRILTRFGLKRWLRRAFSELGDQRHIQVAKAADDIRADIRARWFDPSPLNGATPEAELANALVAERFPLRQFGGCFVCKRVYPGGPWSDHSWGDAVDATENSPEPSNDEITDWSLRMAREGLIPAALIIGSRVGHVISAEAPYWIVQYGGDSSHLWHTHISCSRHDGTPPCAY